MVSMRAATDTVAVKATVSGAAPEVGVAVAVQVRLQGHQRAMLEEALLPAMRKAPPT
jgi:hypothetical protein